MTKLINKPLDPKAFEALLDKVRALTPEQLERFRKSQGGYMSGRYYRMTDHDRYCTVDGLKRQLNEFRYPEGLVYYATPDNAIHKEAFSVQLDHEHLRSQGVFSG